MIVRILAGLIGLAIIVPVIVFAGPIGVEIVVVVAGLVCVDEYTRMAFPDDVPANLAWQVAGCAAVFGGAVHGGPSGLATGLVLAMMGSMLWVTFRTGGSLAGAADKVGRHLVGIGWVGGLLAFLPLLRQLDHGIAWIFLVLAIPWVGDTGAYFSGRAFGRTKLYPLVSPKKTWEGLVGGLILTTVGVFVVRAVGLPELTVLDCLILGAGLGVAAVVGDLCESMLKRAFEVKDSGWIMPGHGGLLDRIDSLLFVAPLLYGYAALVKG